MTQVVIAARGGPDAKTRCAAALTSGERAELTRAMLADMLKALAAVPGLAQIWVTTPTDELAMFAIEAGAGVIVEPMGLGLDAAFDRARRFVVNSAPDASLVLLPGDLPLLDPAELGGIITAWRPGEAVLVAAKSDGGTGAMLMAAATCFSFAYGPASLARHQAETCRTGLRPRLVEAPSLAFDLDRPADFAVVMAQANGLRTRALLASLRPNGRLAA